MLEEQGYRYIAGIDEVGRGALAGPVVAAAVILPCRLDAPWLSLVRDSKQLNSAKRQLLSKHIRKIAVAIGIGMASHEVIDAQGIIRATRLAMKLAVDQLSPPPESLLIDYMSLPQVPLPQQGIKNGDSLCFSIACASIIAKVTRDRVISKLHNEYGDFGSGYPSDPRTKKFVSDCYTNTGKFPDIVRHKWLTVRRFTGPEQSSLPFS